jgi:hypothetical protein
MSTTATHQIQRVPITDLHLDWKNPRLAEFGITERTGEPGILQVLWENMAVEELVLSMVAHGFFDTEPLITTKEDGKEIVLEGNRRLAAAKIILDPSIVEGKLDPEVLKRINQDLLTGLAALPIIRVASRQEAWRFIGFKHINGPARWNSFAKAQHIAQVHKDYGIPLTDIAFQVGDTHNTVQKLFQGMMVIEQAEKLKVFDREDVKRGRLFFSHLYTALQYDGFQDFLGIADASIETKTPVAPEKKDDLGQLLLWLYGSKKRDIEPLIRSQNPDLGKLERVVSHPQALASLKANGRLDDAFEESLPKNKVFEDSLYSAKNHLQKAWSFVTQGYDGRESVLKSAGSLADLADELYSKMESINAQRKPKSGRRLTE